MRFLPVLLAIFVALMASTSVTDIAAQPATKVVTLRVEGMTWVGWETQTEAAVRSLPGISQVDASYQEGKAVAEFDPAMVSPEQIAGAINERTYYRATVLSVGEGPFSPIGAVPRTEETANATLYVEGMTDDRSASQVLAAMGDPGVADVSVDTGRSELTVVFDPARVDPSWFVNTINNTTPFRASLLQSTTTTNGGCGVSRIWVVAAGAGVAGAGMLVWYAFQHRRQPAVARAERRRRSKKR